ncbi:MAG: GNAT family N-acetyltransferase [Chloroflexota bacterium]|nr:GNAT family N-acetyltransferase [Chloroflexota bacterium]
MRIHTKDTTMYIHEMLQVNEEIYQSFQRLIPQLSDQSSPPKREDLMMMAASKETFVCLARHPDSEGRIIGSATLAIFQTPTGVHGWIEDVVVDKDDRRQGVGKALTQACLDKARELGLREVNLTSRPNRIAANRLYQAMGFVRRETNVYRYALD